MDASELVRRRQARTVYSGYVEKKQYNERENINGGLGVNVGTKMSGSGKYPEWVYLVQAGSLFTTAAAVTAPENMSASVTAAAPSVFAPSAPSITSVVGANTVLSVYFSVPTSDGGAPITDYEFSTDNGSTFQSTGSTSSPLTLSGLSNGTTYQVVIRAANAAGSGTSSTTVSGIPVTTPLAPTITGITPGNTALTVAFTAPTNNGGSAITDYQVSTNNGSTFSSAGTTVSPILVTGLTNGTTYQVVIRAVNAVPGSGVVSNMSSGTPATTPSAPTITGITPGDTTLSVAFTAPTTNGGATITGYEVSTNNGVSFMSAGTTTSPLTLSGLSNGTTYQVVIRAVNSRGSGTSSTAVSGTPAAPVFNDLFVMGMNTASITRTSIVVDSQQNVYAIGTSGSLGAVIYNYSQINDTVVEQIEYGRIGDQNSSLKNNPIILIKYNSNGQVQWVQSIAQSTIDTNLSPSYIKLSVDTYDNIIVTCSYGYLNTSGSLLKTIKLQQQSGKDVSNYITFNEICSFDVQGLYDGIVLKYDSNGVPQWFTKLSNGATVTGEYIYDVSTDSNSNIYICGQFGGSSDVKTNIMTVYNSIPIPATNVSMTPTSFGQMQSPSASLSAGYLIKYNSNGQVQWVHMLLGTNTVTPNNRYNGICNALLIDKQDNVILRGWYQTMAANPLTTPPQTLNYTTTPLIYTQSLYLFDLVLPGSPNIIQFQLFGQIPFIGSNSVFLMKFTPLGAVEWVNTLPPTANSPLKSYAVDSANNIYIITDGGAAVIPTTYTYVSGLLANSVINIQQTGYQITASPAVAKLILKINSLGNIVGIARLTSPYSGITLTNLTITCSQNDEIVINGIFSHSSATPGQNVMSISNFVGLNPSNIFDPSSATFGLLPIAKNQDVFLIKYKTDATVDWAINLNTGPTSVVILNENTSSLYVKGQYIYLGVQYGTLPLRLQSYTGKDANDIIQQGGSKVMNFLDSTATGITGTLNNALLKYSL